MGSFGASQQVNNSKTYICGAAVVLPALALTESSELLSETRDDLWLLFACYLQCWQLLLVHPSLSRGHGS
jgi:hypothetical protein